MNQIQANFDCSFLENWLKNVRSLKWPFPCKGIIMTLPNVSSSEEQFSKEFQKSDLSISKH